ncbi:MAG: MATE family efflux transporter [Rikenellaceae bacterium]
MTIFGIEGRYFNRLLMLATPVIIGNAGQAFVTLADNIMVGQLGAVALGSVAFSGMIVFNLMVLGTGIAISLTPLVGESFVNKGYAKCSQLLQNSLVLNTLLGVVIVAALFAMHPLLYFLGQPQEIVDAGKEFYFIVALSIIPYMTFLSFKQFMDGVGNTKITMVITIVSNVLNIILNYIFIYGKFGCPAMGVFGAGFSTFISRLIMPIIYYIVIRRDIIFRKYLSFFSWKRFSLKINKSLIYLGMPIASQMIVEIFALSITTIMFGWMGVEAIAAGQISMSIVHIIFLIASGIAAATTILTSHEYGRGNRREIVKYTKASMITTIGIMTCIGLLLSLFSRNIAMVFTQDMEVIAIATIMLYVISFMEIFDGLQVSVLGSLRGMKEVEQPMKFAVVSYLFVGLPMAYVGGFVFDLGPSGVWLGFVCGLMVAFSLFLNYFYKVVKNVRF